MLRDGRPEDGGRSWVPALGCRPSRPPAHPRSHPSRGLPRTPGIILEKTPRHAEGGRRHSSASTTTPLTAGPLPARHLARRGGNLVLLGPPATGKTTLRPLPLILPTTTHPPADGVNYINHLLDNLPGLPGRPPYAASPTS